jgi:hypothetical protein
MHVRNALMATILAISAQEAVDAQELRKTVPKATMSCGPLALIMVTVVDARGAPVTDAAIDVKRERDGKALPGTTDISPTGDYIIMDDSALPLVPADGGRFIVRAMRGKQTASIVVSIGRTPDGCHVLRLGEARKLVVAG